MQSNLPYGEVVVKSLGPWTSDGWAQHWTAPATHYPVTSSRRLASSTMLPGHNTNHGTPSRDDPDWDDDLDYYDTPAGNVWKPDDEPPSHEAAVALVRMGMLRQDVEALLILTGFRRAGCHVCEDGSDSMDAARGTCHNCGRKVGFRLQADQANAPWGSENVPAPPSPGPYGATEPPQPDMDPGSYGRLAGPDPENWGQIDDGSATQSGLRNESALDRVECSDCGGQVEGTSGPGTSGRCRGCGQEMAIPAFRGMRQDKAYPVVHGIEAQDVDPGRSGYDDQFLHEHGIEAALASATDVMVSPTAISPAPFGTGGAATWHEDQEGWPYVNQSNTAGPSTQITPRDPGGIRMEEALQRALAEIDNMEDWPPEHRGRPADEMVQIPRGRHAEDTSREAHPASCVCPNCEYDRYHSRHHGNFTDGMPGELLGGLGAEKKDEPDAALDPHGLTAEDTPMGGGQAATGSPGAAEILGEFGASRREAIRSRFAFDSAPHSPASAPGQYVLEGDATGGGPGMSAHDEDGLGWDEPSIQTIGQQQWSGGGADSDEVAVEPGMSQGEQSIVAAFQASAAARNFQGGGSQGDGSIAAAARDFLRTASVSDAEAQELIKEGGRGVTARNLDLLDLKGTHYEAEAAAVAKRGLDLDDLDEDLVLI
jgi:ribosomal protein S27E